MFFVDEICSYNYLSFEYNETNQQVKCICKTGYAQTVLVQETFNNQIIQCNYKFKSQSITLFLSIFILFGFEYYYIERYRLFNFFFTYYSFVLIGNCFMIINTGYKGNLTPGMRNFRLVLNLFSFLLLVWWLINNILILTGNLKDGHDLSLNNDFNYLFN